MNPLYKYSSINTNFLSCLANNELYYCTANFFNDPYDSHIPFVFSEISDNDAMEDAQRNKVNFSVNFTLEDYKKMISDQVKNGFRNLYKSFREINGILCLSSIKNNILMWAHYADSHKGICLELNLNVDFSNSEIPEFKSKLFKIDYPISNSFPEIDTFQFYNSNFSDNFIEQLFCVKSIDWKYESEYRSFVGNGNKCFKFPKDAFTSIYFGLNVSNKTINLIKSIRPDLKYFQGRKSKSKFKIEFDPL